MIYMMVILRLTLLKILLQICVASSLKSTNGHQAVDHRYVTEGWSKTFTNVRSLMQCLHKAKSIRRKWTHANYHEQRICQVFLSNSTLGTVKPDQGWTMLTPTQERWNLVRRDVCFGAEKNSPGKFYISRTGLLSAIKLVYKSGGVTCDTRYTVTPFGCNFDPAWISVFITNDKPDNLYFPPSKAGVDTERYMLPGYNAYSKEVILGSYDTPLFVESGGVKLRIYYGEDLFKGSTSDNHGSTCVDVYANF